MKEPVYLYHRDALDCIKFLFNHLFFANDIDYVPHRVFTDAERDVRVYNEWMSSNGCWEMQVSTCTSWKLHIRILTTHVRYHYLLVPHCAVLFCHQIKRTPPICVEARSHILY